MIKQNDRVFVTGKTGTGKTHLTVKLLENVERLIVIDNKANLRNRMNLRKWTKKNQNLFARGHDLRLQIIPPIGAETDYYRELFERLYSFTDYILYIDEMYAITPTALTNIPYLNGIFTRGREVQNIGVFVSTQRPHNIPAYVVSECQHYFMFKLSNEDDISRMSKIFGKNNILPIKDEHGFIYYDNRAETINYYKSIPSNLTP